MPLGRGHVVRHRRVACGRILRIRAGHQAEQQRAILRGARQRPDGVERLRQRHRAGAADAAIGGLQSRDAAEMRGHADRAAGVRAERGKGQPRRDRRARAGRRAAGDVIERPRDCAPAVMGVVAGRAIGEFRHLQRAEPDRCRHPSAAAARSRSRSATKSRRIVEPQVDDLAGVVIHVLVRQRHAVQRAADLAFGERGVGGIGRLQRRLRLDRHEGVETRLPLRDAMQAARASPHARTAASCAIAARDLGQRHQGRFGAHFDTFSVCASRKRRGLEVERQRAGDRRKAFERRSDGIGDARRRPRHPRERRRLRPSP